MKPYYNTLNGIDGILQPAGWDPDEYHRRQVEIFNNATLTTSDTNTLLDSLREQWAAHDNPERIALNRGETEPSLPLQYEQIEQKPVQQAGFTGIAIGIAALILIGSMLGGSEEEEKPKRVKL